MQMRRLNRFSSFSFRRLVGLSFITVLGILPHTLISQAIAAGDAKLTSPVGRWKTIDDETHKPKSLVSLWLDQSGTLYGKVDSIFPEKNKDTDPLCDKCPGDLKNKKVKQINFLWGLHEKNGEWGGGEVLDPAKGTVYRCKVKLKEDGKSLTVRGFIGISLIGRSQTWHRVQ